MLFYHSSTEPQAIVGTATVVRQGYADPTDPRWVVVDIRYVKTFRSPVTLKEARLTPGLEAMSLLKKGNRLSIQPVTIAEWKIITKMGR